MNWIKVWIGIGAVIFGLGLVVPPYAMYHASAEVTRYRECLDNQREDCRRSIVWNLVDIANQWEAEDTGRAVSIDTFRVNDQSTVTPPIRSSEKAPLIKKVEPRGMANANGVYRGLTGDEITLVVTVEGTTAVVSAYLTTTGERSGEPVVKLEKQTDGSWLGRFKLPQAFQGELEIRAEGNDPKDRASLFLPVATS